MTQSCLNSEFVLIAEPNHIEICYSRTNLPVFIIDWL